MTRRAMWVAVGLLLTWAAATAMPVRVIGSQTVGAGENGRAAWQSPPASLACWQTYSEGLPTYAMVVAVAVNPTDPAVICAATYEPPGLWRSDDGGSAWAVDDQGLRGSPVYALHWDAVRKRWWVGARDGLYTRPSADMPWQAARLGEHAVYALAEDEQGRLYVGTEDGLYYSDDLNSWEVISLADALADDQAAPAVLALDVAPDGRAFLAGTAGQGLGVSRDGGVAGSPAGNQATDAGQALAQAFVSAVLLDARPDGAAYASTSGRAYRSAYRRDDGAAWQTIPTLEGRVHAFARGRDGSVYASLAGRVARSVDDGRTWELSGAGLRPGDKVLDLAVAPDNAALVFAAAWDGLYASTDRGQNWARRSDGLGYPDVNILVWDGAGNLLAGTRSGVFRRASTGETWEAVPDLQNRPVLTVAEAGDGRSFYAGCSGGLFRSTDGGQTWAEVKSELSAAGIAGLVVDPADPDHLIAWVAFGRVHESRDGGRSWAARWEGLGDVRPVAAIHRSAAGQLYVGAEDGLFRWQVAGKAWQPLPFPLVAPTVFAVETDARDAAALFAGTTDGLWCSPDRGQTWDRWGKGLAGVTVTALAISPADQGVAFAGTRHAGLYATTDGGMTWQAAWEGRLGTASVRDILFSADGQAVYVASDRGIWQGDAHGARWRVLGRCDPAGAAAVPGSGKRRRASG